MLPLRTESRDTSCPESTGTPLCRPILFRILALPPYNNLCVYPSMPSGYYQRLAFQQFVLPHVVRLPLFWPFRSRMVEEPTAVLAKDDNAP